MASLEDDEYVAKLLAEDARKMSVRYSSMGMSALLPNRSKNPAPKPNARFLKNLVREVDSHNTALKHRELSEAQLRSQNLKDSVSRREKHANERRDGFRSSNHEDRHRDSKHRDTKRRRLASPGKSVSLEEEDRRPRKRGSCQDTSNSAEETVLHQQGPFKERKRSYESRDQRGGRREKTSSRSASPVHRRSRKSKIQRTLRVESDSNHNSLQNVKRFSQGRPLTSLSNENSEKISRSRSTSSDPLESIIGPFPNKNTADKNSHRDVASSVRRRGRGVHKSNSSSIETRFTGNYNPSLDVDLDAELSDERNDWDMALEALRDRQQWKQKHTDRLREAGFDETAIMKWEESGKEKDVTDVQWRKQGETREWDIGKADSGTQFEEDRTQKSDKVIANGWTNRSSGLQREFRKALG